MRSSALPGAESQTRRGLAAPSTEQQSRLARAIYRDHRSSLARMIVVIDLQLFAD
jgi:hypothetical protein